MNKSGEAVLAVRVSMAVMVLLAVGCGGTRYMVRAMPPQQIQPPADQALVVFMRPSGLGGASVFGVADDQGQLIGETTGHQYLVHAVPPGQHTFVAWAENADMMQATVEAGRIYYVLIGARQGAWSARVSLSALTPRREEWVNVSRWLQETTQVRVDPARIAADPPDVREIQERIASAQEAWASYDAAHREVRVLQAADGMDAPL